MGPSAQLAGGHGLDNGGGLGELLVSRSIEEVPMFLQRCLRAPRICPLDPAETRAIQELLKGFDRRGKARFDSQVPGVYQTTAYWGAEIVFSSLAIYDASGHPQAPIFLRQIVFDAYFFQLSVNDAARAVLSRKLANLDSSSHLYLSGSGQFKSYEVMLSWGSAEIPSQYLVSIDERGVFQDYDLSKRFWDDFLKRSCRGSAEVVDLQVLQHWMGPNGLALKTEITLNCKGSASTTVEKSRWVAELLLDPRASGGAPLITVVRKP